MCLLFETIRIEDGKVMYPRWHEARMSRSRIELWDMHDPVSLSRIIEVPEDMKAGLVRCRITYGPDPESITFSRYKRRHVTSLKMVECNHIDYHLKRADRSLLDELFSLRGNCDEIIIIKKGLITDTSVSNLIFFDGDQWYTPETPLLKGTCRERLLKEGKIKEKHIRPCDLDQFSGFKMINAMRYATEESMTPVSVIRM